MDGRAASFLREKVSPCLPQLRCGCVCYDKINVVYVWFITEFAAVEKIFEDKTF
jgi:hypothetical protein